MFRQTSLFFVPALLAAALASACGSSSTPSTPTTPPTQINDTFANTLTVNGGVTFAFVVQQTGQITATLQSLAPDSAPTVGMQIGTWDGTSCAVGIVNDSTVVNTTIIGSANGTGNFCVRVYDVGKLTAPTDFSVLIQHF
jgi:hypothetical protein